MDSDDQDDRSHCSSGSKQSDDDNCSFISHSHRTCNRYTPCNKHRHRYQTIDSSRLLPIQGTIRTIDQTLGHRQRYDGNRWRRICDIPTCLRCLRGKTFYDNWLCREHYSTKSRNISSSESQQLIILDDDDDDNNNNNNICYPVHVDESISKNEELHQLRKTSARQLLKKKHPQPKRGDIIIGENGIRQKYDGHSWRNACGDEKCPRIARKHGFCNIHSISARKRSQTTEIVTEPALPPPPPLPIPTAIVQITESPIRLPSPPVVRSESPIRLPSPPIIRSESPDVSSLKKGDIQLVRQQWNGTKWYSLCHYPTEDCSRRSAGIKYHHFCHQHYREYVNQEKQSRNNNSSASKTQRKRGRPSSNRKLPSTIFFDGSKSSISSITRPNNDERIGHNEQTVQTEVTYPLTATDLRDACFFVDEYDFDDDRSKSFDNGDIKREVTERNSSS